MFMPDGPQLVKFFTYEEVVQLHEKHGFAIKSIEINEVTRAIRNMGMVISRSYDVIAEKNFH